jgi:sigma-B regulation protein RsbU (phosphoserine phosphatase)
MKLHWKMLVLLLAISMIPLIVLAAASQLRGREMGLELAAQVKQALVDAAARDLRQTMTDRGAYFWQRGESISMIVRGQAAAVEAALAKEVPTMGPMVAAAVFDDPATIPGGSMTEDKYRRWARDGERGDAVTINRDLHGYVIAPGVERDEVEQDLRRLSTLHGAYQLHSREMEQQLLWQYTALESGVHSSYPAHGGYPPDFDPRERPWYQTGRASTAEFWGVPIVDVGTGHVIIPIVHPVRWPDGSLAGVTGADVLLTDMLDTVGVAEQWRDEAITMVCTVARNDASGEDGLLVWARGDYERQGGDWRRSVAVEWFRVDRPEQQAELIRDVVETPDQEPSLHWVNIDGREYAWTHVHFGKSPTVVLCQAIPRDLIVADAVAAERRFIDEVRTQMGYALGGIVFVMIGAAAISILVSKSLTRPIEELAETARRIAGGDVEARADVSRRDEIGELAETFNEMMPKLQDRLRLRNSLSLAMEVQQHLLPHEPPRVPGLEIAGRSIYCDETGGDYFDFLEMSRPSDATIGVAVGDVTGHGIAAALLMTTARALLRSRVDLPGSLAQAVTDINRRLTEDSPQGRFMTLFFLTWSRSTREARWVSGGHDPAICYDPADDAFSLLEGHDIPLGIDRNWTYEESARTLDTPGQVIAIGTDGIWEARNEAGEMYGKERLRAAIRSHGRESAESIHEAVIADLDAFRGNQPPLDDVTLVILRVLGD